MSQTYATILYDGAAPVARITLNRPEKRNPIGPQTIGELIDALARAKADDQIGAVVLTGAGKAFCAGGDLSMMAGAADANANATANANGEAPASMVELFTAMHSTGKPIIAMVNGHALAGGMGLMVACDLVVASDRATFGTTEIKVGLWPMMITAEITRNIGRKKTLELMLTGDRIDGAEALRIGLVNRVVPHDELERETMALAASIAERSPAVVSLGLKAFYATQDQELLPALEHLQGELGRIFALEDAAEGIAAFLQKRKPVWKGR